MSERIPIVIRETVLRVWSETNGNIRLASLRLGLSSSQVYRYLQKYREEVYSVPVSRTSATKFIALTSSGYRVGEDHHNARISDATVDKIRELHEEHRLGYVDIAQRLNLSKNTVRKICTYERRAQTPERWKRISLVSN